MILQSQAITTSFENNELSHVFTLRSILSASCYLSKEEHLLHHRAKCLLKEQSKKLIANIIGLNIQCYTGSSVLQMICPWQGIIISKNIAHNRVTVVDDSGTIDRLFARFSKP